MRGWYKGEYGVRGGAAPTSFSQLFHRHAHFACIGDRLMEISVTPSYLFVVRFESSDR